MEYTMKVRTDDKLVLFIYDLLQKGVHVHQIERSVDAAVDILKHGAAVELCNGPLAVVAQEAARLIAGSGTIKVGKEDGIVCSKCGAVFMLNCEPEFKSPELIALSRMVVQEKCPNCEEHWKR